MIYRIELRDRDLEYIRTLDERVEGLSWGYNRIGGCAGISFRAPSRYCSEVDLGTNFNIRVLAKNLVTGTYDLKYQGRLENIGSNVTGIKESVRVTGFGYQSELKDIIFNKNYASTEISVIVKDILDTFVVPNTNITYDTADIVATSFTPNNLEFSYVTAQQAMSKLADITGSREWGVNAERKFFFKQESAETNLFYPITGGKISNFDIDSSSREIINHVVVIGGDVAGSKFVFEKDYTRNQDKYKRRDKIINNSAIVTDEVAEQFADAAQALGDGAVRRGKFTLKDEVYFEDENPLPLIEIQTREINWDERGWDTFLWAGEPAFQISKIKYTLDSLSNLILNVQVGQPLPSQVQDLKQLQFNLDQVVQAR